MNHHGQPALDEDVAVEGLTEKEIKTVEKFHRQLSSHSILSIRTEDGLDEQDYQEEDSHNEIITEEEAKVMQNVLKAFGYTPQSIISDQPTSTADGIDGRNYRRLSSSESYENSYRTSRFLSPGRFYVHVSEETKIFVKDVHEKILRKNPSLKSKNPSYSKVEVHSETRLSMQNIHISTISNEEVQNQASVLNNSHPKNEVGSDVGIDNPEFRNSEKSFILVNTMFGNARNGHTGYTDLSRLPPKERFRELVRRVVRRKKEEKKKKKREFYIRLWEKRGKAGWLDLIFTLIGLGAFFLDSGTDLKVASDHFTTGHPWWGAFTLILVFFPTVLVNLVSYFFYKEDEDHDIKPESGWRAVKITHILQVGLVERYWHILVKAYNMKFKKLRQTFEYKLYISMNLDVAMLQMILAFTEDAPQLVLQLYVLIRRHLVETLQTSKLQDMWTIASICFSFISYSRAVVNYISCLRNSKKHKGVLRWYGYIAMWFWRALMFTSRVLVLVFFASEFNCWFFLFFALHFVLILGLMKPQEVGFFPGQKGMQMFFWVVIAYIHTFCFFVLDAAFTIRWAVFHYSLIAIEAIVLTSLWFTNAYREISLKLELAGLSVVFISYVLGLMMMVVYYKFLHPKFKRPQTKWYTTTPPKEELCEEVEDAENENSESEEAQEQEVLNMAGDVEQTRNLDHSPRDGDSTRNFRQFQVWV